MCMYIVNPGHGGMNGSERDRGLFNDSGIGIAILVQETASAYHDQLFVKSPCLGVVLGYRVHGAC